MNITLDEQTINGLANIVFQKVKDELIQNESIKTNDENKVQTQQQRYMNQKEVCAYLNVSAHTVNSFVQKGLQVIQINDSSRTMYDREDIDRFMSNHKIGTKT
ncbi:helix-turn-helix domain-containing protein [Enterococcus sp. DIV0187]|uniref:helix-turn-helix domain-containing protein n=1 Tax=Enterococcus sp. DIV0187 TaxID=2774644 RepID=UPI003F217305